MIIKRIAPLLLLLLSACSPTIIREKPPTQASRTATKSATPQSLVSQADIDYAENFAASIFAEENWESEVTIHEDRVTHRWTQRDASNLAYLDYRIYAEGYPQATLDAHLAEYYSEETFRNTLFSYYDNLESIAKCNAGNLTLYMFRADYKNFPYLIRYWVNTATPNRIADFSMVFTVLDEDQLDAYAQTLFPALPKCP